MQRAHSACGGNLLRLRVFASRRSNQQGSSLPTRVLFRLAHGPLRGNWERYLERPLLPFDYSHLRRFCSARGPTTSRLWEIEHASTHSKNLLDPPVTQH